MYNIKFIIVGILQTFPLIYDSMLYIYISNHIFYLFFIFVNTSVLCKCYTYLLSWLSLSDYNTHNYILSYVLTYFRLTCYMLDRDRTNAKILLP